MSAIGMFREGKIGAAIVRVIETLFGINLPPVVERLLDVLLSELGLLAKEYAQRAWDAADDDATIDQITYSAVQTAAADGKVIPEKLTADWVGMIDRNQPEAGV